MTPPHVRYPLRGEIWWTRFPTDPPEKGRRPVIIVSPDSRNGHPRATTVLAVPLSTSIHKSRSVDLLLRTGETGLGEDSVAMADDICTLKRDDLEMPVQGHRVISNRQICRLADLVSIAMGCVERSTAS